MLTVLLIVLIASLMLVEVYISQPEDVIAALKLGLAAGIAIGITYLTFGVIWG